ncbi:MAG: AsnC family transcriptional regulator [Chloroflexi bacterium]|nr:AsnC family transcriptional regulator [Chloroflexota bacterium]
MELDRIDRQLINRIQSQFPLTAEPFASLGTQLNISQDEVINRIARWKANRIIRLIGPVMDARRLGYQTTLVAMSIPEDKLEEAARVITKHPGVSHNYEREHHFNLWFTLAIPPSSNMETELKQLTGPIDADACFALPARKLFKINACFNLEGNGPPSTADNGDTDPALAEKATLSRRDKDVINALQTDLPLEKSPFSKMAAQAAMNTEKFLAHSRTLMERGIVRRYGASLNHRKAGFTANGMACWEVPAEKVDSVGKSLASRKEVSHCYERETNRLWKYNLFAMIHGQAIETCREIAAEATAANGLADYVMLFSTREFKKQRIKYPV